jgi:hypothetical protein
MTRLMQVAAALCLAAPVCAQPAAGAARLVAWKPKPGQDSAFEAGYKRHLEWHRSAGDRWTWLGWTMISGDREDQFVDGTFFHAWTDFDTPVQPAADGANNAINTVPYADGKSIGSYEAVSALTNLTPDRLTAPLLTFCYIAVRPGADADFESALRTASAAPSHAVLRPVNGTTDYLILMPADKLSELPAQAAWVSAAAHRAGSLVEHVRTETGRHRPDMSYHPQ